MIIKNCGKLNNPAPCCNLGGFKLNPKTFKVLIKTLNSEIKWIHAFDESLLTKSDKNSHKLWLNLFEC